MNYLLRRKNLLNKIKNGAIILFSGAKILKSADEEFPFEVNKNFYYLSGINQPETYLFLSKKNEHLYILPNNEKLARWVGYNLTCQEAKEISQCKKVSTNRQILNNLKKIAREEKVIYLDLTKSDFHGEVNQGQRIKEILLRENPNLKIKDISKEIYALRAVKDNDEIEALRHSINITRLALNAVMENIKKLNTEKECQALFEERIASLGLARTSFPTIAAAGKNATTLHYSSNNQTFNKNDVILMDLGACINFYNADITRDYPHNGTFNQKQKEIYDLVLKCNKTIIDMIKPDLTIKDLQEKTKEILADGLIKLGIINTKEELSKYYFHSVSHHLGLDTHDPMDRKTPLKAGNVITVEPGLYIEELGIGIRIEDDVLVTSNGSECLSKDIIKEVHEIENYIMQHE